MIIRDICGKLANDFFRFLPLFGFSFSLFNLSICLCHLVPFGSAILKNAAVVCQIGARDSQINERGLMYGVRALLEQ